MNYYIEWCPKPSSRAGVMVPLEKLPLIERQADSGFRSVYMFTQDDADKINKSGNSKGFDQYTLISNILFIDLDDGDTTLPHALAWLKENNISAKVYSSGSKGYHLHIDTELLEGDGVAFSHNEFVKTLPFHVDESLYRPGSLIALPGRRHSKTGKKKTLIQTLKGDALKIEYKPAPPRSINFGDFKESSDSLTLLTFKLQDLVLNEPPTGKRFNSLWLFCKYCAESGLIPETAYDLMRRINERWQEPKTLEELERAIKQAYHL